MNTGNSSKTHLSRQIETRNPDSAKTAARGMSAGDVGDVLQEMAGHEKPSVRMLVLELASEYPSEGASRAILSRLQDPNLTVRSIANSQIGRIAQKSLVPELFKAMEQDLDSAVKGALARQIGLIGDASDVPRLQQHYRTTQDPILRNDLSLAMARLGDPEHRQELRNRLTNPDLAVRIAVLRDIPYAGDSQLARYFRPVLEDRRDAVAISLPHDPVVAARVCDLAIQAMAALGINFSFPTSPMRRFTEAEIQEALHIVAMLDRAE